LYFYLICINYPKTRKYRANGTHKMTSLKKLYVISKHSINSYILLNNWLYFKWRLPYFYVFNVIFTLLKHNPIKPTNPNWLGWVVQMPSTRSTQPVSTPIKKGAWLGFVTNFLSFKWSCFNIKHMKKLAKMSI